MGNSAFARRGSVYIIVLGSAVAVAVIGLSALAVVRINRRSARDTAGLQRARIYAQSAIEMGLFRISADPNWRTTHPNGVWALDQPIGTGTYTLDGVDPNDADLTNNDSDSLVLTGTGVEGDARYELQVSLLAELPPLDALATCLHAAGTVQIISGKSLTVTGAPLSSNSTVSNSGTVYGDVEASSVAGGGTVTGTITAPAPVKDLPDPSVFDTYKGMATAIAFPSVIDSQVLSPGSNPWGATNPDGLYFIDTGGNDLVIQGSRINGTLVVRTWGGRVLLQDAVFLHNYRSDYPVLIVDGNVEMLYNSDQYGLIEGNWSTNFNPVGSPYQGGADPDQLDQYPNEVQGLVHVKGTLLMKLSARVRGVVLCESSVSCQEFNEIVHEPALYQNPPFGYTKPPVMRIAEGSWRRIVN